MLSIVIPTLNEEKYLPELLKLIKDQNFDNYEVIVSDAYSEDNTVKIARDLGALVVQDRKKSPARQRNQGAARATGDTILFLDADTKMPVDFLNKVYNEFLNRKLKAAGFYLIFNSTNPIYRLFEKTYRLVCVIGQYFFPASVGVGIMVDREAHEQINGFDESIFIGEDYDYIKRLSKIGKYRMIKSAKLFFSVRRLEKEGMIKVLWKWFRGGLYFIIRGPIRKKIVEYNFGKY